MADDKPRPLRPTLEMLLMAALIAAGSWISLPLWPVPLTLQTYVVLLAGFLLGSSRGALAAALYLVAGLCGLPVFAGGSSGLAKLTGPTGGFLLSFPLAALVAGVAARHHPLPFSWRQGLLWGALASAVPFLFGLPWLKLALGLSWAEASATALLPFLPGAAVKLVLSVATYRLMQSKPEATRTRPPSAFL